jgi:tetratricopeptide (TPR) repeat protein
MGAALAIVLAAGLPDAQAAFARGEYAEAEAIALAAAQPPQEGAALNLAGLARFRAGRPAAALEALDQAARSADAPEAARWHFNRGACLYELGRFAEAEQEYLAAASDPALAAVALVNAGFAALDGGSSERARSLAERARAADSGAADELISDLEAHAADAIVSPPMPQALSLRIDGAQPRGPAPLSWQGVLTVGAGFDSDALQSGLAQPGYGRQSERTPSAVAVGNLDLAWRVSPDARVSYGFDQLSFLSPSASERSLQQHAFAGTMEVRAADRLRLGGTLGAQLIFVGVSKFRGLQASAGSGAWAILEESDLTSTRVDLGFARKSGLSEFGYLSGNRIEAGLSQELRFGATTISAGYWLRDEDIGSLRESSPWWGPADVIPFGYLGHTFWGSLRLTPLERLRIELSSGVELRGYAGSRRDDQRFFGSATGSLQLWRGFSLALRYDLLVNRSNQDSRSSGQTYDKRVLTLGTSFAW